MRLQLELVLWTALAVVVPSCFLWCWRAHQRRKREQRAFEEADARIGFTRPDILRRDDDVRGTLKKPYDTHVFFSTGPSSAASWPAKVELSGPGLLFKQQVAKLGLAARFKVSAFESNRKFTVLAMSRALGIRRYYLDTYDEESIAAVLAMIVEADGYRVTENYIFVCAHSARDDACGHCGPILIDAFSKEISQRGLNINVHAVSHVGGHKYAGNIIVFHQRSLITLEGQADADADADAGAHGGVPVGSNAGSDKRPQPGRPGSREEVLVGDWYGYVGPGDVGAVLNAMVEGGILTGNWRGTMGSSPPQVLAKLIKEHEDTVPAMITASNCASLCARLANYETLQW